MKTSRLNQRPIQSPLCALLATQLHQVALHLQRGQFFQSMVANKIIPYIPERLGLSIGFVLGVKFDLFFCAFVAHLGRRSKMNHQSGTRMKCVPRDFLSEGTIVSPP